MKSTVVGVLLVIVGMIALCHAEESRRDPRQSGYNQVQRTSQPAPPGYNPGGSGYYNNLGPGPGPGPLLYPGPGIGAPGPASNPGGGYFTGGGYNQGNQGYNQGNQGYNQGNQGYNRPSTGYNPSPVVGYGR